MKFSFAQNGVSDYCGARLGKRAGTGPENLRLEETGYDRGACIGTLRSFLKCRFCLLI